MKVIGNTGNGYILEASKDDVAAIEGKYSHERSYKVGDVIDIYGLYNKYRTVDSAFRDIDRLRGCAKNILTATEWIEEFNNR